MTRTDLLHDYITAIGGAPRKTDQDGYVDFVLHGCAGYARIKEGGSRLRASVEIAILGDTTSAVEWVEAQPLPPTSELAVWGDEEAGILRLVWERSLTSLPHQEDPVSIEVKAVAKAWHERTTANIPAVSFDPRDPRDLTPEQAWLIVGDESVWPTDEDLAQYEESGDAGIFENLWTSAKQTQEGDLVLVYIMGARKAVHFVARAASNAFFSRDIDVSADDDVRNEQWWVYLTPLIEVAPIPFADLKEACNGQLILKGRSGKFLPPDALERLTFVATDPEQQTEVDRVVRTPVGRADLPEPHSMTWEDVRDLAGGALRLESEVSRYIVEPLLRQCLEGTKNYSPEHVMTFVPEYPIGKKRADYVVLKGERPVCVVEVKLAINDSGEWANSPDLRQMIGYASALECCGVLIDASRIVLIPSGATVPERIIQRRSLNVRGIGQGTFHDLAEHIGVPYLHRTNGYNSWREHGDRLADLLGLGPRRQRLRATRSRSPLRNPPRDE